MYKNLREEKVDRFLGIKVNKSEDKKWILSIRVVAFWQNHQQMYNLTDLDKSIKFDKTDKSWIIVLREF